MDQNFSPINPNYPSGQRKLSNSRSGYVGKNITSYVYRPGTANTASKAEARESIGGSSISNINIVNQVIGKEISNQNMAVEIERLKTTCQSLNQKASVADDLRSENQMLRKRISELEKQSDLQKQTIAEQDENIDNYQSIRQQMQAKISQLETSLSQDGAMRADMEKMINNLEKSKNSQIKETNLLVNQNKELKKDMDSLMVSKTKLQDELDKATEYIISMEEKVFKSNKISLELLK